MKRRRFVTTVTGIVSLSAVSPLLGGSSIVQNHRLRDYKVQKHIDIYRDPRFYCIAPSIIARQNGELILAFRRARERRAYGEKGTTHLDNKSQMVLLRSQNNGKTWSENPEVLLPKKRM